MGIGVEGDMDTREQARKLIPLLQAYADGKTLQWRQTSREWLVTEQYPTMWSNLDDWRVKPEPREVVRFLSIFANTKHRWVSVPDDWDCEKVRVIEVLDDDE